MSSDSRSFSSDSDHSWSQSRSRLLNSTSSSEVAESPFLFMDRRLFAQALAKIRLFELVRDVQGSIVECGVHKGNSLMLFSHLLATLSPVSFNKRILGFDSFEGFSSLSSLDCPNVQQYDNGRVDESLFARLDSSSATEHAHSPYSTC